MGWRTNIKETYPVDENVGSATPKSLDSTSFKQDTVTPASSHWVGGKFRGLFRGLNQALKRFVFGGWRKLKIRVAEIRSLNYAAY